MASTNNKLLMDIATSQATLVEQVKTMNTRLFGGEGQKGVLPILFEKVEAHDKEIQEAKDKSDTEITKLKETEIADAKKQISELNTATKVTMWKVGSIGGLGGTVLGVFVTEMLRKIHWIGQ